MKVAEAIEEHLRLANRLEEIDHERAEIVVEMKRLAGAVFSSVRVPGSHGEKFEFQIGTSQYLVCASGTLKRINALPEIDGSIEIQD